MKIRVACLVFVTCLTAAVQVGAPKVSGAELLDYQVPPAVAQEVATIVLTKYVRDCSWEQMHYTYYISSEDKRVDVDRLIRSVPTPSNVLLLKYTEELPLESLSDELPAKAKTKASISVAAGTPKRLRLSIQRYASPLGVTTLYYIVERRWFRWRIVEETTGIRVSANRPNKAPEPTPGSVTPRATEGVSK